MAELNGLSFERLVEFVEVDLTTWGDTVYRFINTSTFEGETPETATVPWAGNDWQPLAFEGSGFQRGGENLVRPSIAMPDFGGAIYVMLRNYNGAYGAPVTRYMALADDVEANNPYAAFLTERYVINTVGRSGLVVHVELATHVDFAKRKVPGVKMERQAYPGLSSNLTRS